MELGAIITPNEPADPQSLADLCQQLVADGYTSLWTPHAIGRGQMLTDPLMALAVAATCTDDVLVGTAIAQLPLYAPADVAHRVMSLHQICGDRLILGVGPGSTPDDFAAFGQDFANRFDTFEQSLAALRSFLSTGSYGDTQLTGWPQVGGAPPIYFGTWGKGVERAAAEFDGWIASGMKRTVEQVEAAAARFHAAGGGPSIVSTILLGPKTDLGELRERFERYAAAGFDHAVVMLLPGGPTPAAVRALMA